MTEETETTVLVTEEQAAEKLVASGIERLLEQKEQGIVAPIVLAEALKVRPQMIYNYIRSGRIKSVRANNTGKLTIDWNEAVRFAQKYLDRKAQVAAKAAEEAKQTNAA